MKTVIKELFLNNEVIIYPGDTHTKKGIVIDIDNTGVTFKITSYESKMI